MSEAGPPDYTMAEWPTVRAVDGAAAVLDALSRKFRIAVATNAAISRRPDIVRALERVGLAGFISDIFCRAEIGAVKSDPKFWRAVTASLGAAPDELLMIGDSLEQDVRGPQQAGIAAIWFNWKLSMPPADAPPPTIYTLSDLPPLFGIDAP